MILCINGRPPSSKCKPLTGFPRGSLSQQFFPSRALPPPRPLITFCRGSFTARSSPSAFRPTSRASGHDVKNYRLPVAGRGVCDVERPNHPPAGPIPDSKTQPQEAAHEQFQETTAFLSLVRRSLASQGVANMGGGRVRPARGPLQGWALPARKLYNQSGLNVPDNTSRPGENAIPIGPRTFKRSLA